MAYATVAGLPVSVGLYTAFVPMIVYAFLGTSRVLSVSGDQLIVQPSASASRQNPTLRRKTRMPVGLRAMRISARSTRLKESALPTSGSSDCKPRMTGSRAH
jgi:hypothetical protein